MKIFIGSSSEAIPIVREIEVWIESNGNEPIPWDKPGIFTPGANTLETLIEVSRNVDGAIFIFSEDDKVWYRKDTVLQPRDNVLLEYGLFTGTLGPTKVIIYKNGNIKDASDIKGINYIDVSPKRRSRAKLETNLWCQKLGHVNADPALIQIEAKVFALKRVNSEMQEELKFEKEKAREYENILTSKGIIDFDNYDLNTDGKLKLLYKFDFVTPVTNILKEYFKTPKELQIFLRKNGLNKIDEFIGWGPLGEDTRVPIYLRKILRVFRIYNEYDDFNKFINMFDENIIKQLNNVAEQAIIKQRF